MFKFNSTAARNIEETAATVSLARWGNENFNIYLFDNSFDMFELYIDGESIVDVQLQEVKK